MPVKKKEKGGSCSESPASAEGIWSPFPGVVPRSGQTRHCHHPSSSMSPSSAPGHVADTFLSPHTTSSHGLTLIPDVACAAAVACLFLAV